MSEEEYIAEPENSFNTLIQNRLLDAFAKKDINELEEPSCYIKFLTYKDTETTIMKIFGNTIFKLHKHIHNMQTIINFMENENYLDMKNEIISTLYSILTNNIEYNEFCRIYQLILIANFKKQYNLNDEYLNHSISDTIDFFSKIEIKNIIFELLKKINVTNVEYCDLATYYKDAFKNIVDDKEYNGPSGIYMIKFEIPEDFELPCLIKDRLKIKEKIILMFLYMLELQYVNQHQNKDYDQEPKEKRLKFDNQV